MATIGFEDSIAFFLEWGRRLQTNPDVTGELVLNELTEWYVDTRIAAASGNNDMLLLQWGASQPLDVRGPVDSRRISDDDLVFVHRVFEYLDFTRQVFPGDDREDLEFDDAAVQLSVTLYFGEGTEPKPPLDLSTTIPPDLNEETGESFVAELLAQPGGYLFIDSPADAARGVSEFTAEPFVATLITQRPRYVNAIVNPCG